MLFLSKSLTKPSFGFIVLSMSINTVSLNCMNCGAPLELQSQMYNCLYCGSVFKPMADFGFQIPTPRPELVPKGLFEVSLGSNRYRVLGRIAAGEHSRVLLARRARATTEQVVIKVADSLDRLEQEWSNLSHLEGRCSYLDRLLPRPVEIGLARGKPAIAYRWRSGFVYNLAQVKRMFPGGVDPAATVWMWNRILDQLTSLRQLGYSHGRLCLEHLLVHPRDHGIAFCSWSEARTGGQGDLASSGRCMEELMTSSAPRPLRELARHAGSFSKARELKKELEKVARAVYGPPRFRPFVLNVT